MRKVREVLRLHFECGCKHRQIALACSLSWAEKSGPHVVEVVRRTLARYPAPEMGYRPALGILRCAETHGAERMDAACQRVLSTACSGR